MGFSPREVYAMSLWEFTACCDGYAAAHGGGESAGAGLSDSEFDELSALLDAATGG